MQFSSKVASPSAEEACNTAFLFGAGCLRLLLLSPLLLPLRAAWCSIAGRQWGSLPPCGCCWLAVHLNAFIIITLIF
jgi:hypothetical protein